MKAWDVAKSGPGQKAGQPTASMRKAVVLFSLKRKEILGWIQYDLVHK